MPAVSRIPEKKGTHLEMQKTIARWAKRLAIILFVLIGV